MSLAHLTSASVDKLTCMSWERRRECRGTATYRVMLFRPFGMYPEGTFVVPNGLFHASASAVFSVVLGEEWNDLDPDLPYTEFDWASPQELRLLSSLVLCEKRDDYYLKLYPITRYSLWLDVEELNFTDSGLAARILELLRYTAAHADPMHGDGVVSLCLEGNVQLVPSSSYNLDRLQLFWECTQPSNYVLMRAMAALIKSDMLCHYREFWEEALLSIYVALDASFHLITENVRSKGVERPTAHDAAVWLHKNFDEAFELERYFEDFYEQRVMTLHPESRHGRVPFSPTMHDDVIHLRRSLREIFAYLVSGAHAQDYYEELQRTKRGPSSA
jgi:hypothetical protein